ncbi:MAG: helix-turn-helix transcriptional regulator [Alphaproteobacteria bacterium]|nr:helix-turn-helix transcriptional regulator [Alphaproteobacteria bacterium]
MKNVSGKRIKEARKHQNLSQVDLAAALDVDCDVKLDRSDISEIERGVRGVKDFELDAIAQILEVSPEWLLRGD